MRSALQYNEFEVSFEFTYLPALELALEIKLDKSRDSPVHWELSWRLGKSIRVFNNLFGFIKLTIVVVREREVFLNIFSFFICIP